MTSTSLTHQITLQPTAFATLMVLLFKMPLTAKLLMCPVQEMPSLPRTREQKIRLVSDFNHSILLDQAIHKAHHSRGKVPPPAHVKKQKTKASIRLRCSCLRCSNFTCLV